MMKIYIHVFSPRAFADKLLESELVHKWSFAASFFNMKLFSIYINIGNQIRL